MHLGYQSAFVPISGTPARRFRPLGMSRQRVWRKRVTRLELATSSLARNIRFREKNSPLSREVRSSADWRGVFNCSRAVLI